MGSRISLALFAAGTLGFAAVPAAADTPEQLGDQLGATAKVPSGLGLVRRQLRDGDLTGALAAVERVIILDPLNAEARLLHASLLCRLDDRTGSQSEFDPLRGHDLPEAMWRDETAPCEEPRTGAGH
jgi:Flp pilus assembly protein TadD